MIFPIQLRAARALVGWSQQDLADQAGIGIATVKRIEASGHTITGAANTIWKLQNALENEGVAFISPDAEGGPGVRLKAWNDAGQD